MPQLSLADGRVLAYEEWGAASGAPIVFLHGSPGSRLCCPDPDATARAGVRLVTYDRPGYGGSDRSEGRALLDTPGDVAQLAGVLGIGRFSVLGVSGGGPHALACALALADRIDGVGIVSAPGPLDDVPSGWEALGDHMRPTARAARIEPWRAARSVVRYMQGWVDDPESYVALGGPEPDRLVKADPTQRAVLVVEVTEALRPGAGGLADDLVAFWRPWGFSVADVPAGARVWHGAHDTRAAPDFAYLVDTLVDSRPTVWPDAAHLGILPYWSEVLEGMRA